jgi:aconitate hydratase 2/2-methylisocitrate dehydratase
MLQAYRQHAAERAALGIPPLPLDAKQVAALIELIKAPPAGEDAFLLDLLTHRVPPGVDDAAKVKASYLAAVAHGALKGARLISRTEPGHRAAGHHAGRLQRAARSIELLDDAECGRSPPPPRLKKTLLDVRLQFHDVARKRPTGRQCPRQGRDSRAGPTPSGSPPAPRCRKTITADRVQGARRNQHRRPEPLRPTPGAAPTSRCTPWPCTRTRARAPPSTPEEDGKRGPDASSLTDLEARRATWWPTWATWWAPAPAARPPPTAVHLGHRCQDIPFVPNKRFGGVTLGGKIAPIFYNTQGRLRRAAD